VIYLVPILFFGHARAHARTNSAYVTAIWRFKELSRDLAFQLYGSHWALIHCIPLNSLWTSTLTIRSSTLVF